MKTILKVEGLDCPNEVAQIDQALNGLSGVTEVNSSVISGKVTIVHNGETSVEGFVKSLAAVGLTAASVDDESTASRVGPSWRLITVVISGMATMIGLILRWTQWLGAGETFLFGIAIVSGGWFIAPKAYVAIRRLSLDMNVLMSVAVLGAIGIGEWSEGAAVAFLFALSELLESYSVSRARKAIQSLMELTPETAVLKDGNEEVPVSDVDVDSIVLVRSGARVPLDGQVVAGESTVDQSPITGESMPVEKSSGDDVFAGTINGEGLMEVRVTKAFEDTTLSRIIHLVEEAQSQKAPSQRFVDVFAKYYTPAVMILALLVLVIPPLLFAQEWSVWIYRALVLLVIACPCALVISTPVSIVSGLTALARKGVLVKGGAYLEAIGRLRALALDKTGTITEGKPKVAEVVTINGESEQALLRIAAAIENHSNHPLAKAIVEHANKRGIAVADSTDHRMITGRGVEAEIDGEVYFVGNHRYAHELGGCTNEVERAITTAQEGAHSVAIVGTRSQNNTQATVLGIISIGDTIRPNAKQAVQALHEAGVERVVMLSGDNRNAAEAIGRQVGIDEVFGDLLPEGKIDHLKDLKRRFANVGMVGDGVNDAPAMATATVGIAMGAAGTDTAIETADVALMNDDLLGIARAIEFGRRTVRIIQANIAFALLVKAVFLVLAVFGITSLWLAILADTGATLIVIANALRLLRN